MADQVFQPETVAIHVGQIPDAATGTRALPNYQIISFVFDSTDHAASLFNLQTFGNVYSRLGNLSLLVLDIAAIAAVVHALSMRCRMESLRVFCTALSPMSAWRILQGVETLPLRMECHCSHALKVAKVPHSHPAVIWVNHSALPSHPQHALLMRQVRGASGLLPFGVKGCEAAGMKFIESAQFLSHLVNLGDTRTLISHPASTTHRQLDAAQQLAAAMPPDVVCILVGLEHIDDILWDIDQALAQAGR